MGGYGSGRWGWHSKATTVEECISLDANRWMREGILVDGIRRAGGWQWTYGDGRKNSISYQVNTDADPLWVRLMYKTGGNEIDYKLGLQTTPCTFGGVRWWFTCPLVVGGRCCGRRVGKVYLPAGQKYFGCRHCYGLSYRSSQESDKRVSALLNNPAALLAIGEGIGDAAPRDLFLFMKALQRLDVW